jgi:hypothetical protein
MHATVHRLRAKEARRGWPRANKEEGLTHLQLPRQAAAKQREGLTVTVPGMAIAFDLRPENQSCKLRIWLCVASLGLSGLTFGPCSASSLNPGPAFFGLQAGDRAPPDLVQVRAAVARGGRAVVGPRGGAAVRNTAVVGPRGNVAVRNTAVVAGRGAWARPGWYRWPRGGAIAAGAAIGFVTAATAVAWAGSAPAPGMCWYYTDPSRTQGFWDYCP